MSVLDDEWGKYKAVVMEYANEKFEEIILPFLNEHGYSFIPINNTYRIIEEYQPGRFREVPEIPSRIEEVLNVCPGGFDYRNIGSLMPEHFYSEWMNGDTHSSPSEAAYAKSCTNNSVYLD